MPLSACGERACSQQLHAADHLAFDERAHAGRVAVDESLLDAYGFSGEILWRARAPNPVVTP